MKPMLRAGVAAILCGLTSTTVVADLSNGGFESPANPPAAGNYLTIGVGQEYQFGFCGWTVEAGTVDVVDARLPLFGINWMEAGSIDGDQILDLNGTDNGTLAELFNTVVNQTYTLNFWYANNPLNNIPESALVTVTDVETGTILLTTPVLHSSSTLTDPDWSDFSQSFVAIGAVSRVRFASTTPFGGPSDGVVLDAVSIPGVTAYTPPGDMNGNGRLDVDDIPDFVNALLGRPFVAPCAVDRADVNSDSLKNGKDIQLFVNLMLL